jgi:ABC-2 type transport system ATP-binding protein
MISIKMFLNHTVLFLDNLSLHLEEGKVYGIVGENGSGKTTLFKCIGLENTMAISFAAMENQRISGYLQTEPYFF